MTAHLTEQEQMEALKRWWKDNGKSTLLTVVLGVALFFGWQGWQNHSQQQAESASAMFQDLIQAMSTAAASDESLQTARHLALTLKTDYAGSFYAVQGALSLAKLAVDDGELAVAEQELTWALDNSSDEAQQHLIRLRLARVLLAMDKFAAVQQLVSVADQGTFASAYAEVQGDLLVAEGNLDAAITAYQQALDSLVVEQDGRRLIIEMKLNQARNPVAVAEEG